MRQIDTRKTCRRCGVEKEIVCFSKNKSARDGLQERCKSCVSEYMKARMIAKREELREKARSSYYAHRDDRLKAVNAYRVSHRESVAETKKRYYEANRPEIREKQAAYRERSEVKKALRENKKHYYLNNREEFIAKGKEYRRSDRGKSTLRKAHAKEQITHQHKMRSRWALSNAVRDGRVIRSKECQHCKAASKLEAHHHKGYEPEFALDVLWLCNRCHRIADGRAAGVN